jgi:hypothetical protein
MPPPFPDASQSSNSTHSGGPSSVPPDQPAELQSQREQPALSLDDALLALARAQLEPEIRIVQGRHANILSVFRT